MKFIDTASIKLKAGKGGDGCISFRREKYVPKGGPNGGNGGNGASIYFIGDKGRHTLMDFRYKAVYKAEDGEKGKGSDMHGRAGEDLILPVPLGTIIRNAETGDIIADITVHGDKVLVARGGRGGRGNMCFATPEQRAPRYAEDGKEGEELEVELELKLLADVGIIGFPNAGKSTFISVVSAAKPKIADYPFTSGLEDRTEIITATKMDSCNEENLKEFEEYVQKNNLILYKISAISHNGTKELIEFVSDKVDKFRKEYEADSTDNQ